MQKQPLKYLFFLSCATLASLTIWLSVNSYTALKAVNDTKVLLDVKQKQSKVTEMLLFFDMERTQDARNYIFTADHSWLTKYQHSLANFQYYTDSLSGLDLSPGSKQLLQPKTELAQLLLNYEEKAFAFLGANQTDSAIQLINSPEYDRYRDLYLAPFRDLRNNQYFELKQMKSSFEQAYSVLSRDVSLLISVVLLGLIVLPIQGYFILQFIRRIRQANTKLSLANRELKVAEQEIKASELNHQTFFETNQSGIFRIDFLKPMPIKLPQKDQFNWMLNHAYIGECNDRLAQMYGFNNKEEIVGKSLLMIWDEWENIQQTIYFYLTNNFKWTNLETTQINAEGEKKYFLSNTISVIEDEHIACIWSSQTDITEKKEVENRLIESEANFRAVVTNSTPIVFMLDKDGKVLLSEGKMLASLGLKPGEMVGQTIARLYQDYPYILEAIRKPLQGEVFEGSLQLDRLSFEIYCTPIYDADQNITGAIGMALDITQRMQAELALKKSETNLISVVENTSDVIFSLDTAYRVLTINTSGKNRFKNLLGIQLDKGDCIIDLLPAYLAGLWKERYDRALAGERFMIEDHYKDATNEHYADVYFNPIWDDKKVTGIAIFSLETTHRKRAEQAVLASEQEKSNLLMALDEAALVSITDLKGNMTHVNEKYCQISGYEAEELIGERHNMLNSGFHPKSFWLEMWKTVSSGETWRGEVNNKTKDGQDYWMDTIITPIRKPNGEIYEYMSINYLITEHKHLFMQREELLRDLEDYAFQTSHKIRGPLARILGLTNLILEDQVTETELQHIIKMMQMTSEELDQIIIEMNETLSRTAYYKIKNTADV